MPTAEQRFVSFPNKYGPYFVFHEKLTKKSALGLMLIVGGTLLMLV